MEGGGGDVASLKQNPFALPLRVVARLAVNAIALAAALEKRLVHRHGNRRDELPVRVLARKERRVLLEPTDRDGPRNGLAHRRPVVEEIAGRLREDLRLIVHARVEMDRRTARRAAARAAAGDERGERQRAQHASATTEAPAATLPADDHASPSRAGLGLRTLAR